MKYYSLELTARIARFRNHRVGVKRISMTIQSPEKGLPRRPARPRLAAAATAALAIAATADRAVAEPYNPYSLPADQVARIDNICQSVIGVRPGEAHYVRCVASLMGSARSLGHDRALARASEDCLGQGLTPDTPELSECMVRSAQATPLPASAVPAERPTVSDTGEAKTFKSYFYTSPRDVHRQVELSCAQLGFDPRSNIFASCVTNLRASLFAADNSIN